MIGNGFLNFVARTNERSWVLSPISAMATIEVEKIRVSRSSSPSAMPALKNHCKDGVGCLLRNPGGFALFSASFDLSFRIGDVKDP